MRERDRLEEEAGRERDGLEEAARTTSVNLTILLQLRTKHMGLIALPGSSLVGVSEETRSLSSVLSLE